MFKEELDKKILKTKPGVAARSSIPTLDSLAKKDDILPQVSFRGSFDHNLDTKGRVSIPSLYRSELQRAKIDSLVLTNYICDGSRCLEAFPLSVWEVLEDRLRSLSRFNPRLKSLENYYFSRAAQCSLDSSGRIIIPQILREYAGIKTELTFTSGLRGFRLWDTRVWQHVFSEAETSLLQDPDLFLDLDL